MSDAGPAPSSNGSQERAHRGEPLDPSKVKYAVEERNVALTRMIGRPQRVLDVGCGIGLNGLFARQRGAEVVGIEIAAPTRKRAEGVLHRVVPADIESDASCDEHLRRERFDLILFGDVLEHTADPRGVLQRLCRYLADEGHVLVSLPNVAAWTVRLGLLGGRFDYTKSGILDDTHLRFFTRASAARLVEEAGLEVMRFGENPLLVRAAKDLIGSAMRGTIDGDPTALMRSLPYKAYQGIVRPIEAAIARAAPGLFAFQNVILARKRPVPRKLSLTVGMLTMDEEGSIERMIGEIRAQAPDAKILCVDSSTKDATPDIARRLGARVLRQVPPRGHGPAMEVLLYEAAKESDALIYLDCDFTYPTSNIPVLRSLLENEAVDVVNSARTHTRPEAMPMANYVANRAFAAMAHGLHGVPTCDVHSGMRAYRSSVIRAFDFDGEGDALPIDTLLWPAKCGYRVVEIPISYDERVGTSKLRKVAGTAWTFIRLARAFGVGTRGGRGFEQRGPRV